MEILLAIIVIGAVGYYFFKSQKEDVKVEEAPAPYKVETPVAPQVTDAVTQAPAKKPAAKKPAAKKAAAKKPAAKKTTKKSTKAE